MDGLAELHWARLQGRQVAVGDIVSAEAGGMPRYRVLAVTPEQARLEDVRSGQARTARLSTLHWVAVD